MRIVDSLIAAPVDPAIVASVMRLDDCRHAAMIRLTLDAIAIPEGCAQTFGRSRHDR
jgi:hypothetical protein